MLIASIISIIVSRIFEKRKPYNTSRIHTIHGECYRNYEIYQIFVNFNTVNGTKIQK